MNKVEYIGLIAGFLTTSAFVPQIIQIFKTKSTKDVSLLMYIIFTIGLFIWLVYGYLIDSYSIIIVNIITIIFSLTTIVMKLKYK